jgi:hypothetical protein
MLLALRKRFYSTHSRQTSHELSGLNGVVQATKKDD